MAYRLRGRLAETPVVFPLHEGVSVLGSAAECELRLNHPTVSRRHAELHVEEGRVEVVDLDSSNGTFVGARRVRRAPLAAGELLAVGQVALTLELVAAGDLEAGLSLGEPEGSAREEPGPAPTTAGLRVADTLVFEHLPSLIRRVLDGADAATLAQAGGAALFAALPCREVEVTSGPGAEAGVLFRAERAAESPGEPEPVAAGGPALTVRAVFAHANAARLFAPVVRAVADLILLAGEREPRRPRPAAPEAPPWPDPPSVVPAMQRLYAEAARVAQGDVGVLLTGESGTGKEVLARFLHAASARARGAFVALNCAALPRDLLETELFGIERGVATGVDARPGKFELAHGGTLFLDEVGDMALETQARILRVLQEGEVHRIGGSAPRPAAVRVISATNRDLPRLRAEGRFREDLYYRIATWTAELPPLRARRADIPNLAAFFLAREARRRGLSLRGISRAALDRLLAYDWPGNVRQLEKELSRAVLFLGEGELLDSARLSPALSEAAPAGAGFGLEAIVEEAERKAITRALQDHQGDVDAAAGALGISRSTLYRRLKALGITPPATS
ncbi:MAG TPA: sigma 54-interacting transcriptional regulator [Vicinamibacteria bacterium]